MDTLNLQVGKYIQQYKLKRFIGKGSSSVVWEVEDRKMRKYALKIYSPEAELSSLTRSVFIEEFNFAKGVDSINVVKYHKVSIYAGRPFIIMDLCSASFRFFLEQASKQQFSSIKESHYADLLYQLSSGINALNKNGIIHNDIKPDNILLNEEGGKTVFKLTDFGVSSSFKKNLIRETIITNTPHKGFTPYYSAPECRKGITKRNSDIYSLGVVLAELITGKAPKNESEAKKLLTQKMGIVSNKLISIIYLCLLSNASERPSIDSLIKWSQHFMKNGYWSPETPNIFLTKESNKELTNPFKEQPFGSSENALNIINRVNKSRKFQKGRSVKDFRAFLNSKMGVNSIKRKLNSDVFRKLKWPITGIIGFVVCLNITFAILMNFSPSSTIMIIAKYSSFLLLPSISKKILDRNNGGLLKIKKGKNEKWGAVNSKGELVIPYKYDKIEKFEFKEESTRYSIVRINGKCGFISQDGRVTQALYDVCKMIDEKTGFYEVKNKYGKIEQRPILLDRYFEN